MDKAKFDSRALENLKKLPFVSSLSYVPMPKIDFGSDATLVLETGAGRFELAARGIGSYISNAILSDLLTLANRVRKEEQRDLLILARYVPRPLAEFLVIREIHFIDTVGNAHLRLGKKYNWTVIGVPDQKPARQPAAIHPFTRAELQFLFFAIDHPRHLNFSLRKLALLTGISKTAISNALSRSIDQRWIIEGDNGYEIPSKKELLDKLAVGYRDQLRPKLFLGGYHCSGATNRQTVLERLKANKDSIRYSLTGNAAIELMDTLVPGSDVTFFVADWTQRMQSILGLEPRFFGPIVVLRAFGNMVFESQLRGHVLAPLSLTAAEAFATLAGHNL